LQNGLFFMFFSYIFIGDIMLTNTVQKKIIKIQIIVFLILSAIGGKLCYSQIIMHKNLRKLASNLWERSFPLEASRGNIIDRDGVNLAINLPVISIVCIPYQVENPKLTSIELAKVLNVDSNIIYNKITKKASIVRLSPEGRQINDEQASIIQDLELKGIYLVQDSKRYYPYEQMLSNTLGFVGIDNQGLAGIEKYYDEILKGQNGSLNYIMDAKGGVFGNYSSKLISPLQGESIELTIDYEIQSIMERELGNAYLKYEPQSIYGIAMDPNNGEILAIANYPSYNPNKYKEYDQELINRNLPVWKSYEPGSTFKVFSFAAGLEEKKFNMYSDTYYDKGYEIIGGAHIKSWKKGGHGLQTFLEVLENSSNPGFVEIARRLGKDNLYKYIKQFGFGNKTNVDILGESSGIMFNYDNYGIVEQATSAFGQGVSVTAVQMVSAFSSLINGGNYYEPYIVKRIRHTSTNEIITQRNKKLVRNTISKETSELMKIALESVVANGSGRNAYIDGYRVGGKTGTAQIPSGNGGYLDGQYILSFIGAAPMNDPKIVVYVCLDQPKNKIQYGGTVASPIVKAILEDSLINLGIPKQSEGMEKEYTWMDTKLYSVENYIGKKKNEVKSQYFTFEFKGEGDIVIDQLPSVGTRLEQGKKIVIMLGDK